MFRVNRILSPVTDRVVCISRSVRDYFVAREALPTDRYVTIPNAIDLERWRPRPERRDAERTALGVAPDEILLGSVGSITSRKAQHVLVEAAAKLRAEGLPVVVRIWGANLSNPQHAESTLRETIANTGMEAHARILPPRPDIENAYAAMDFHCMPSIAEGLSLASLEAMACGAIAVYSDIPPFLEVVQHGRTGLIFRKGSPEALAEVLRDAIAGRWDLASLRREASLDLRTRFGSERWKGDWGELYSSLEMAR